MTKSGLTSALISSIIVALSLDGGYNAIAACGAALILIVGFSEVCLAVKKGK